MRTEKQKQGGAAAEYSLHQPLTARARTRPRQSHGKQTPWLPYPSLAPVATLFAFPTLPCVACDAPFGSAGTEGTGRERRGSKLRPNAPCRCVDRVTAQIQNPVTLLASLLLVLREQEYVHFNLDSALFFLFFFHYYEPAVQTCCEPLGPETLRLLIE
jgi:hypothetical protein